MDQQSITSLWGVLKFGAIRPNADQAGFMDLVVDGASVSLREGDPGLRELSPYRLKGKKALVLFWQTPNGDNHIYAVYVTNNERLVAKIKKIMDDQVPLKRDRLLEKRPRYML